MRIVTYDEIDPGEAMLIHQAAFGHPITPDQVKLMRELDRRCSDLFGVYALNEEGHAVSQVQVLYIETETVEGPERIAGIAGVATLPEHSRRGLATALMTRVHDVAMEQGIRISMLLTSKSMVAHGLYVRLGYSTLTTLPHGFKRLLGRASPSRPLTLRDFEAEDADLLDQVFTSHTSGRLGFVKRQEGYMGMMVKTFQIPQEQVRVASVDEQIVGYLRCDEARDTVKIYDLVGVDDSIRSVMLEALEADSSAKWAFCFPGADSVVSRLYESGGYTVHRTGWSRVMAACIDGSLTPNQVRELYGLERSRFVIHRSDMF